MKSILKKALGVLICLTFLPTVSVVFELILSSNPNYTNAILYGFALTIIIALGAVVGWQVGKVIAWCFKND